MLTNTNYVHGLPRDDPASGDTFFWNYGNYKKSSAYAYGNINYNSWGLCNTSSSTVSTTIDYEQFVDVSNYIAKIMWRDEYDNCHWGFDDSTPVVKTPQERLRDIIQSRQSPAIHRSRKSMNPAVNIEEMRARDMLRRVIGDDKFRDFMRNGFVSVQAKSGRVYQIFPGHGITNVYSNGEKIEKLCVVLRGQFPPTDSLVMRYLLILNDENDFRSYAIQHKVYPRNLGRVVLPSQIQKSLPELFRGLKVA